jgi:cysteine desulfuration protein SufE
MASPIEKQEALRETLGSIPDPQERMAVAMAWKNNLDPLRPEERQEQNLVPGCASRVWLAAELRDGQCHFRVDADSIIVRGLASLLCGIYDGATPAEVLTHEATVLDELGITRNLTPTRQNGLAAIRQALVAFAATKASRAEGP